MFLSTKDNAKQFTVSFTKYCKVQNQSYASMIVRLNNSQSTKLEIWEENISQSTAELCTVLCCFPFLFYNMDTLAWFLDWVSSRMQVTEMWCLAGFLPQLRRLPPCPPVAGSVACKTKKGERKPGEAWDPRRCRLKSLLLAWFCWWFRWVCM